MLRAILQLLTIATLALLLSMPARQVYAAGAVLVHTFDDPTPTINDAFGARVAIDGDNILIGAFSDDTAGDDAGQAHLFDAVTGNLLHTFVAPKPQAHDLFGFAVAIQGNNALIGEPRDGTNGPASGQAHLFPLAGVPFQTFNDPTPKENGYFGSSVAIDGINVLIGAPGLDFNGVNPAGEAHLFDVSGSWLRTFANPIPTHDDAFGRSVAIEGNLVLIGAPGPNSDPMNLMVGRAFLFDALTGNLLKTFDDPTPTGRDNFGWSVAIDGNNVLIGARSDSTNGEFVGQAHLFDAVSGNLLHTFDDPTPTVHDSFGFSVAIDGNNVMIGAREDDTNGASIGQAHLFDAVSGNLLHTFDDPTPSAYHGDLFGQSVAVQGTNVVIGSPGDRTQSNDPNYSIGQAHLFGVPTPSSLALMGLGIASLVMFAATRR